MNILPWAERAALAVALTTAACGSGESKSHPDKEEDSGAKDSGRGGAGSGGKGSGGKAGGDAETDAGGGQGGDRPDSSVPGDTTAPKFGGATGVADAGEDRAKVSWSAATDDQTPANEIAYRVYRASKAGAEDFKRGRRCGAPVADAGPDEQAQLPCYTTTPAGATNAVVIDAIPGHTFYYVVRAVDSAGNEDGNKQEVSVGTADKTGPFFGGVDSVEVKSAHSIEVSWGAAYDLSAADSDLKFQVFVQADGDPVPTDPTYVSKPGEHTTTIAALTPQTHYTVWVQAVDPTGNVGEGGDFQLGVLTPEGVAPTFDGAKRASARGREVLIVWPRAFDNRTDTSNIVYDVYSSQAVSRGEDYKKPPRLTTPEGASSVRILEPEENTKYYYVVRARDVAGNQDTNTKEVQALTEGTDHTSPLFGGVTTVTSSSPTTLTASWEAANDSATVTGEFTYDVYVSTSSPVDLTTPRLTVKGVTSVTVPGLSPDTTYYVSVRAKDRAGNPDEKDPIAEKSAKTQAKAAGDAVRPVAASTGLTATTDPNRPTEIKLGLPAATDLDDAGTGGSPAAQIRFQICLTSTGSSDCGGAGFDTHTVLITPRGATTATLRFLTPRTGYRILVRAEDENGNVESTAHIVEATTQTSWSLNVLPVLAERCYACHSYVISPAQMVDVLAPGNDPAACGTGEPGQLGESGDCRLPYIVKGKPEFSILYRKVEVVNSEIDPFSSSVKNHYEGLRMPLDTSGTLTDDEIFALKDWITQGAISN